MPPKKKESKKEKEAREKAEAEEAARVAAAAAAANEEGSTHEEEEDSASVIAAREKSEKNCARVVFRKPQVKHIVSAHTGSILANEEPHPPLDGELAGVASNAFAELAAEGLLEKDMLPEALVHSGFQTPIEHISHHLGKIYSGPDQLTEADFLMFLERFHAPAYYFGQRMRKYASRNQSDEVSQLLARNCDVNTGDGEGLTTLHYCCEYNRPEIIKLLVELAGDKLLLNAQDRHGWTPLHCAANQGNKDCVRLLLDLGADVSIVNVVGKTALHLAVAQNRGLIVDMLLIAGADLNLPDACGQTPIHEASYRGQFTLYNELVRNQNADCTPKDILGNDAARYASEEEKQQQQQSQRLGSPGTSSRAKTPGSSGRRRF